MTDELKSRVLQLEGLLQRKDDELQAKTASFQDALQREQERSAQREAKEATRRQELNSRVTQLQEEVAKLRTQVAELQDARSELDRRETELKACHRELAQLRLKAQEERKEFEEQLNDRRRAQERHRQEVSDLRCHTTVIEHRLQHALGKLAAQDSQTEEVTRLREEIRTMRESRDAAERTLKTEAARYHKERKASEDRAETALEELRTLQEGPSRVELCAKYETKIAELADAAFEACALCAKPGGPALPKHPQDPVALRAYIEAIKGLSQASPPRSPHGTPLKQRRSPVKASPSNAALVPHPHHHHRGSADSLAGSDDEAMPAGLSDETRELLHALHDTLGELVVEKQVLLARRFLDTTRANRDAGLGDNASASRARGFGVTSGFPSVADEPASLVNHIAIVTSERDRSEALAAAQQLQLADYQEQIAAKTKELDDTVQALEEARAENRPRRQQLQRSDSLGASSSQAQQQQQDPNASSSQRQLQQQQTTAAERRRSSAAPAATTGSSENGGMSPAPRRRTSAGCSAPPVIASPAARRQSIGAGRSASQQ